MAPDLNSVPGSPYNSSDPQIIRTHHASTSPRISAQLPSSTLTSPMHDSTSTMPMRHPRPITPAELHQELEKEQEAIVNRLTRELTALRAHSASNASTHNALVFDPDDPPHARRHRSSSSLSARSRSRSASNNAPLPAPNTHPSSQASVDRARDAAGFNHLGSNAHSRANSIAMPSPSLSIAPEERREIDALKAENEMLKARVRELESGLSKG